MGCRWRCLAITGRKRLEIPTYGTMPTTLPLTNTWLGILGRPQNVQLMRFAPSSEAEVAPLTRVHALLGNMHSSADAAQS
jgi:hypothetical protein